MPTAGTSAPSKRQLTRLSAADFRFGTVGREGRSITVKGAVIEGFELWTARDPRQRVLWPTTVQFSQRYFDSLMRHAVPLNETAVANLSHSAMALDIYTWLAQRLHRIQDDRRRCQSCGSIVVCARTIRSANRERAYPNSPRFDNHNGALLQRARDIR